MKSKDTTGQLALDWARRACDTLMRKYAAEALPPKGRFHYHQGVFLSGMYQTYLLCGEEKYFEYVKRWVDSIISLYGDITEFNPGQLDDLQPGILLFPLLRRTGDVRYRRAIETIAYYYETFPCNPSGGYWHKAWYRNQMWLDGLYMAGPFCAEYGATYDKPAFLDRVTEQARIMEAKTRDDRTGLWFHAWDYDRQQPWADQKTGLSPEFWGRSIGWAPVALLDDLDFFPQDHPGRETLERMIQSLVNALLPYQDKASGRWHQVVDKGGEAGNWLETSCSCLYVAAICKGVRKGIVSRDALAAARSGYDGVIGCLGQQGADVLIDNVCVGTGVGNYAHYCARPTSTNDLHGVGAFLLMCAEAQRTFFV